MPPWGCSNFYSQENTSAALGAHPFIPQNCPLWNSRPGELEALNLRPEKGQRSRSLGCGMVHSPSFSASSNRAQTLGTAAPTMTRNSAQVPP